MPLSPGTRLGPYEIIARVGVGGMGEVFRARDTRLGRNVAVKVLPAEFANDPVRLQRFEQEARAASALNHPNIITVYDVGAVDGVSYLTMELVEGKPLRALVENGPVPLRRGLDLAAQIADGLAKAHDAGIIHRDLKPDNIMVSADGFAKILDFGLAKLILAISNDQSRTAVKAESTPGTVLGTIGYMSPEQARGERVDFRSDQFSLGSVLYEMFTGTRPFHRATAAETLTAIIREDPEPIAQHNAAVPAPLRWVIERCLAKEPNDRYASTKDLARDLRSIGDHLSESSTTPVAAAPRGRRGLKRAIAGAIFAAAVVGAASFIEGKRAGHVEPPEFTQITFRRGAVTNARFAHDGRLLYGAAWEGDANAIFENLPGGNDARPLGIDNADILAISSPGEMALMLDRRATGAFTRAGTLAQMSLNSASAPRRLLEDVREADWTPDGKELMIVRDLGGRSRIEFPVGHPVYETSGWIGSARFSRDGSEIAFVDHASTSDDGGRIVAVDRNGSKRFLTEPFQSLVGLAWSPDGKEVWFTGSKSGSNRSLYGVSRSGALRLILRTGGVLALHDVATDGRVALSRNDTRLRMFGGADHRDLGWFDFTLPTDLSDDGKTVAFTESGDAGGAEYSSFIRGTDGSPAVRLGPGASGAISPDGRYLLSILHPATKGLVVLYATGAGQSRQLAHQEKLNVQLGDWMPDSKRVVITASESELPRVYMQDVSGGAPRPISPEGFRQYGIRAVSPDGRWVLARSPEGQFVLLPTAAGAVRALSALTPKDRPSAWTADGTSVYLTETTDAIPRIYTVNLQTGAKTVVRELPPIERAGLRNAPRAIVTPDGKNYVISYGQTLSTLYVVNGVR